MNKHLNLNVGYMWTNYEDYTKKSTNYTQWYYPEQMYIAVPTKC